MVPACCGHQDPIDRVLVEGCWERVRLGRDLVRDRQRPRAEFGQRTFDPSRKGNPELDRPHRDQACNLERRDRADGALIAASQESPGGTRAEPLRALLRSDPDVGVEEQVQRSISQSALEVVRTRSRRIFMLPFWAPSLLPAPSSGAG